MSETNSPGNIVRRLREERGWTIYRLAKDSGLTGSQLTRIEQGQTMHLLTALKLTQALGVSLAIFDQPKG